MTTDVTYRGNVGDPGDNLTETITTNSTAGGGTLVNSFAYSYDANKNKLKETIGGPLNPYGFGTTAGQEAAYDAEDRLTDWHRDDTLRDLNYALSKVGDWNTFSIEGVTETRTHGNAHELTNLAGGANPGALTHDAKGNITTSPAHGSQTYVWDFDNQLKQAVIGGTHKYYYDALGRRVMKHEAGEKKLIFIHDGQRIIAEYKYTNGVVQAPGPGVLDADASNSTSSQTQSNAAVIIGKRRGTATIQRKYVYSTYIDERCLMIDRTTRGALPAATEELFYYHRNNLYSTAAMTDAAGLVQERYAYDAYGNILQFGPDTGGGALGTPLTVSALGQPYTYTGRRLDDETENYHYRYRYYQAPLGRFLSRDRILYGDGYNMYAYVGNGPLGRLDPSGLWTAKGVMDILCCCAPDVVEKIAQAAKTHKIFKTNELESALGAVDRSGKMILVDSSIGDEQAAATLSEEVFHVLNSEDEEKYLAEVTRAFENEEYDKIAPFLNEDLHARVIEGMKRGGRRLAVGLGGTARARHEADAWRFRVGVEIKCNLRVESHQQTWRRRTLDDEARRKVRELRRMQSSLLEGSPEYRRLQGQVNQLFYNVNEPFLNSTVQLQYFWSFMRQATEGANLQQLPTMQMGNGGGKKGGTRTPVIEKWECK